MSRTVREKIGARRDLVEAYRYYLQKAGRETADRFLARVESTYRRIADFPESGELYDPDDPRFEGLRCMRIARFPNQIIFYLPLPDEDVVEVLRVLHGARDVEGILDAEFE